MKLQLQALSLTLGLVTLLGVCTPVKSETFDVINAEESIKTASTNEMRTEELEATKNTTFELDTIYGLAQDKNPRGRGR